MWASSYNSDFSGYQMHIKDGEEGFYIPTMTGNSVDFEHSFYYHDLSSFGDIYAQSIALNQEKLVDSILSLSLSKRLRNSMGKKHLIQ